MSVRYKAVFFDWGGVIARDPGDGFLADLLMGIGATEEQKDEILDTYKISFMKGQLSEQEYWESLREKYGLTIHDSISDEFKKWKGLEADKTVLDLVHVIKAQGVKAAILSNVIAPTYGVIKEAGYYDLFDEVIASCEVGYAKPEREIYLIALRRLGIKGEEAVFIDDKQKCLDPAEELGFTTMLVENHSQFIEDLKTLVQSA